MSSCTACSALLGSHMDMHAQPLVKCGFGCDRSHTTLLTPLAAPTTLQLAMRVTREQAESMLPHYQLYLKRQAELGAELVGGMEALQLAQQASRGHGGVVGRAAGRPVRETQCTLRRACWSGHQLPKHKSALATFALMLLAAVLPLLCRSLLPSRSRCTAP